MLENQAENPGRQAWKSAAAACLLLFKILTDWTAKEDVKKFGKNECKEPNPRINCRGPKKIEMKKIWYFWTKETKKFFLCTSLHIQICDIQEGRSVSSFSIPSLPKKGKRTQLKHFICRQEIVYKDRILEWNGVGWLQIKNPITTDPCYRIYKYVNTINTFWIVNAPLGYSKARLASDIFYWEKKISPHA